MYTSNRSSDVTAISSESRFDLAVAYSHYTRGKGSYSGRCISFVGKSGDVRQI